LFLPLHNIFEKVRLFQGIRCRCGPSFLFLP
jgi:hypothetical protein